MEVVKGDKEASKGIRHLGRQGGVKMQQRGVKERRSGSKARERDRRKP